MARPTRSVVAVAAAALVLAFLAAAPAAAWHGKGHHVATVLAVQTGKDKLPEFFVRGAGTIAHCSLDPDMFTRPIAPPALHAGEGPEHYFDMEQLGGTEGWHGHLARESQGHLGPASAPGQNTGQTPVRPTGKMPVPQPDGAEMPANRYEFIALCATKTLRPEKVGMLPYAVTEWTQKLTVAFAEYRAYPDDPAIRAKCLTYAGLLSHYAEDLCQPLHVTIHHDGRAKADGSSPRSGIHGKVDALLGKLKVDEPAVLKAVTPAPLEGDLLTAVLAEIGRSHALVERVYEMENDLPAMDAPLPEGGPAAKFTAERLTATVQFTASLYQTAWRDSAAIKLPKWYARPYPEPLPTTAPATAPAEGKPEKK